MTYSFSDFMCKEVINVKTGIKIGYVDDIEIHCEEARIVSIIVYGRKKCFGLLGREADVIIKWCDIDIIGEDTILVSFDQPRGRLKKKDPPFVKLFK
ncbi:MAG: YlmC/YmxH family sporulation protein [Oscillospiraceae bacterium]